MSTGQSREVDLDLLADYVGGALDGTPEEAAVARLIADDDRWSAAHDALLIASGAVTADLADWGAASEPMPADVTTRITTALADAARIPSSRQTTETGSTTGSTTSDAPPDGAADERTGRRLTAVPGGRPESGDRAAARRRRMRRWAAPATVAAGVVAFAAFGVTQLVGDTRSSQDTAAGGDDRSTASAEAAEPYGSTEAMGTRRLASGTDYDPATLRSIVDAADRQSTLSTTPDTVLEPDGSAPTPTGTPTGASGLETLSSEAALSACVDAVSQEHGRGPVAVDLVDYAAFQGTPALVVLFTDSGGQRWVWVAGPGCGQAGSGADTRYRTSVG
ncbi:hypothetical protein [Polymorphospora lycopeni]|uniref:Uncharacterized protein n=1 Tax=Polymorphospora lycopeni TaxID=3140240 RepID=A0ABV5CHU6_9ACTN